MPSTHPYALIVDGIIILVLLSLSVYKLIRIQREKNIFRKLNIKGNEIEIFEKSDDSYFDKYLNEVLYLFENSDADVIVFEDMDRFNTYAIYTKCGILCCFLILLPISKHHLHIFQRSICR